MAATGTSYEAIIYRVQDHIAYLTFNRPESLNAFNRQMMHEITLACAEINRDPEVRVVIVSGAGDRAFSAGLDLKEVAAGGGPGPIDGRATRVRPGMHTHHGSIANIEKPTIAAVHGWVVGGGLEMALACDIRVASEDARLGLTEIRRGIMPGAGGTQRLSRVVGRGHALLLTLTGEPIDAQEAYRIGLVSKVVPRDQLIPAAEAIAASITQGAPISARFIKEAINKGLDMPLDQGLKLEVDLSTILHGTEDAREGPRAFAEKRPPVWTGR